MKIARRAFLGMAAGLPFAARAAEPLSIHAGTPGSSLHRYAQDLTRLAGAADAGPLIVRASTGSAVNVVQTDADPAALGLAFLYVARSAVEGGEFARERPRANVRALFVAFKTGYHIAARRGGPARFLDLDGARVGVGPEGGADETVFADVARNLWSRAKPVNGSYEELAQALVDGGIDALWTGGRAPVPAVAAAAERIDLRVFGLSAWEIARQVDINPALAPVILPANTYRGQTNPVATVGASALLLAHKDLPEPRAYALARAAREAGGMLAADASAIRGVPLHPGALRFYREAGIALR
jgi:TRAP transporter TAXI family solute receptor